MCRRNTGLKLSETIDSFLQSHPACCKKRKPTHCQHSFLAGPTNMIGCSWCMGRPSKVPNKKENIICLVILTEFYRFKSTMTSTQILYTADVAICRLNLQTHGQCKRSPWGAYTVCIYQTLTGCAIIAGCNPT